MEDDQKLPDFTGKDVPMPKLSRRERRALERAQKKKAKGKKKAAAKAQNNTKRGEVIDGIFSNPGIQEALLRMPPEQVEYFRKMGEEMYKGMDVMEGNEGGVDLENMNGTLDTAQTEQMHEAHANIVNQIRSGMHPSYLEEEEKEVMKRVYGKEWYAAFGFEEEDVDDFVNMWDGTLPVELQEALDEEKRKLFELTQQPEQTEQTEQTEETVNAVNPQQ